MSETKQRTIVKKVENAVLFSDGTLRIDNVRFSHPHIGTPYEGKNDKGVMTKRYGVVVILPKTTHVAAKDLVVERINELLKENKLSKIGADRKFIRNGDDAAKDEYEGTWTVSAGETKVPDARDKDKTKLTPEQADEKFYGGMYGNVLIRPWFQMPGEYGTRVNAGLVAVQYVREGEPFGSGRITAKDVDDSFDDVDGDESFSGSSSDDNDGL